MLRSALRSAVDTSESAQRLWVLERPSIPERGGRVDACCFLSAVAVLAADEVGVGFVRSLDLRASTAACLTSARVRLTLERNLTRFPSLDAAIAWAESKKRDWRERGWMERNPDPNES